MFLFVTDHVSRSEMTPSSFYPRDNTFCISYEQCHTLMCNLSVSARAACIVPGFVGVQIMFYEQLYFIKKDLFEDRCGYAVGEV